MKLLKKISIALLVACVLGGSAVSMTACSRDPSEWAYSDVEIKTIPEQAPIDALFRSASLDGYAADVPFVQRFEEIAEETYSYQMLNTTIDDWSLTWHEDWPGEAAPSLNSIESGEALVSCRLYYGEKGEGPVTYIYFGYNREENKLYPVRMSVYDRGKISSIDGEEANDRIMQMLGVTAETSQPEA